MDFINLLEITFWALVILPIHSYLLYPLIIWSLTKFKKNSSYNIENPLPYISILISAFNEEKVIHQRVENIANQDYDFEKLELLIGSDNSTDKTELLLINLQSKYTWLKVYLFEERRGKSAVINDLVKVAKGNIIIFTDANTEFGADALINITKDFVNEQVGGISGILTLVEPKTDIKILTREIYYWDFEVAIKEWEGKLGVLIGANGGIFAIRRELFEVIPVDKPVTDDLFITLSVLRKGYKFLYNTSAIGIEETANDLITEFKRKVRFASTNFQTLSFVKDIFLTKGFLLSFSLWSHKIIRWITPVLLVLILCLNIYIKEYRILYLNLFYFQTGIYTSALLGYLLSTINIRIPIITTIFYFIYSNIALGLGLLKFLTGLHSGIWKPTKR